MSTIQDLAATLHSLATPGMGRKDFISAVRVQHPEVSKKDIVRAAFYALTAGEDGDLDRATRLHEFALAERTCEGTDAPAPRKRRKKNKQNNEKGVQPNAG